MRVSNLAAIVAFFSVCTCALAVDENVRTVHTSGTATVFVKPDEVHLRFSAHTFDADLAKAKSANDSASSEAVGFLKSIKVQEKDIQAERMRTERVYEEVTGKPREFKGYTVARDYSVVLRDPGKFEALTDWFLTRTQYSLGGFEFRSSESRKFRDEARRNAVRAAREKAELLVSELKCTVGQPRLVNEVAYSATTSNWAQNRLSNQHEDGGRMLTGGGEITPLGQIAMEATVEVTFDLLPAER
jgi:uncharacterized protein YggE